MPQLEGFAPDSVGKLMIAAFPFLTSRKFTYDETAKTAIIVALITKLRIIFRSRDILPYLITDGQKKKYPLWTGVHISILSENWGNWKHYRKIKGAVALYCGFSYDIFN